MGVGHCVTETQLWKFYCLSHGGSIKEFLNQNIFIILDNFHVCILNYFHSYILFLFICKQDWLSSKQLIDNRIKIFEWNL